jgi:hypothetical protein
MLKMIVKPEFVVNGLEFSEVLPNTYSWDELMAIEWPEGWRVPKRWELSMLYEEEHSSRCEHFFWSDTTAAPDDYYALGISFVYGFDVCNERDNDEHVRLVRDVDSTEESHDFGWALRKIKEGCRVRRKTWRDNSSSLSLMHTPFQHVVKLDLEDFVEPWLTFSSDVTRDDWETI